MIIKLRDVLSAFHITQHQWLLFNSLNADEKSGHEEHAKWKYSTSGMKIPLLVGKKCDAE